MEVSLAKDLRSVIIQKAVYLFLQHGFIGTTLEDISAAVGLSRTGFYKFFTNKEQLLAEILRATMNEIETRTNHLYHDDSIPYERRIQLILENVTEFFTRLRSPVTLRQLKHASPALYDEFNAWRQERSLLFQNIIRSGIAKGKVDNRYGINEMMTVYLHMFSHCMDYSIQPECTIPSADLYAAFMELYLYGVVKETVQ